MDTPNATPFGKNPGESAAAQPAASEIANKLTAPVNTPIKSSEPDYLFYNVMPHDKNQGAVVGPSVKVVNEANAAPTTAARTKMRKYIIYGLIALAVIAIGYGAYIAINKFAGNSYKADSILVKQPPKTQGMQQQQQPQDTATAPSAWQKKYFGNDTCQDMSLCGDHADPDHDGLNNLQEYTLGTDPNNPDSDKDGIGDGDEVNVFGSDPLNDHTAGNSKFNDADYVRGGYDIRQQNQKLTDQQLNDIIGKMRQFGLHEPTLSTIGSSVLLNIYHFDPATMNVSGSKASSTPVSTSTPTTTATSSTSSTLPSGIDNSSSAKLDRDTQRSNTIQNIAIALVKYYSDLGTYPNSQTFDDMYNAIKPYIHVATKPIDPINQGNYVYTYTPSSDGKDFTLTYYSETQNQLIKTTAAGAQKYATQEQASTYDEQRKSDLETLRSALLIYSNQNLSTSSSQNYAFPPVAKYKTALVPSIISSIPTDPKTNKDYEYQVSNTFDTFTLKAALDAPPTGTTGYMCNQDECRYY